MKIESIKLNIPKEPETSGYNQNTQKESARQAFGNYDVLKIIGKIIVENKKFGSFEMSFIKGKKKRLQAKIVPVKVSIEKVLNVKSKHVGNCLSESITF